MRILSGASTVAARDAKEDPMCQTCGCSPCKKCGMEIKNGVCVGCNKPAENCSCEKKPGT